ncbi:MAG: hypothetical protein R3F62_30160 [Planctomycetota bacterium]
MSVPEATAVVIGARHGSGQARICFDLARGVVDVARTLRGASGTGSAPLHADDRALAEEAARRLTPGHQDRVREDWSAWFTEFVEVTRADGSTLRIVNERGSLDLEETSELVGRAQELAAQLVPLPADG